MFFHLCDVCSQVEIDFLNTLQSQLHLYKEIQNIAFFKHSHDFLSWRLLKQTNKEKSPKEYKGSIRFLNFWGKNSEEYLPPMITTQLVPVSGFCELQKL